MKEIIEKTKNVVTSSYISRRTRVSDVKKMLYKLTAEEFIIIEKAHMTAMNYPSD